MIGGYEKTPPIPSGCSRIIFRRFYLSLRSPGTSRVSICFIRSRPCMGGGITWSPERVRCIEG